ncbi:MAG: N-acetyltransferase [Betaproteobacteria bacterium]|nr:N-acetyltransferase [Betaproteobacteria bacterium]MCC7215437.1 N-acetyltransferase [Burkholderiales bacterium]
MNDPTPSLPIVHDLAQGRFEARVDGGLAHVDYRRVGDTLHMMHTEVPPAAEGRGVAAALVQAALDHAADNGLKVMPLCSYVRAYMRRHPDTHALLAPAARV